MNWTEEIKKFNLPQAKIMYIIYYLTKIEKLSNEEKLRLKGNYIG